MLYTSAYASVARGVVGGGCGGSAVTGSVGCFFEASGKMGRNIKCLTGTAQSQRTSREYDVVGKTP